LGPLRAAWLLLLAACAAAPARIEAVELVPVAHDLRAFVDRQLREMVIPGAYVAVLDVDPATGRQSLWAEGFARGPHAAGGEAPATRCDAVVRPASISKLFTATALMRLVEQGRVDLDVPVATYLPDFAPESPFGGEVTLRHLLGHRAGLVREPPVGHYFDPSEPSLAATVHSLNDTRLVFAPGSGFKYSNPGPGVVGQVVANVTGRPFEQAVRELVLEPLGLRDSDFAPRRDLVARQAHGVMWTYDGRDIPTPEFAFGFGPAADLRSTVVDLVHFARSWSPFATTRVLRPDTQAVMWQLPDGQTAGCGLGFFVRPFEGHRQVGHDGAVYGFASALRALPEQGLAVAVVVTKDFANAVAEAIADRALLAALANRRGDVLPPPSFPRPLGVEAARRLAGHYRCGENWVDLYERGGELIYDPNIGMRTRLRRLRGGVLVSDDPLSLGDRQLLELAGGRLHDGEEEYVRDDSVPAVPPAELLPLLGEYGWDHNVLVVYEDRGRLAVLIEWVVRDLPEQRGPDDYWFPPGMYGGDSLRFERDGDGEVTAAVVGGARFIRRPDPVAGGFRITPVRPVEQLRALAAAASPPPPPADARPADLVELATLDPTLHFDLRYATANNFLGTPVYPPDARAKLQRPAAEALLRVHRALAAQGLGLCVFDAYRPWSVTKVFFDAVPPSLHHFVADPAKGSRHNRGCAVDVTLYELATGRQVEMPSGFDEFTARAYPDYPGGTSRQRHHREVLRRAMAAEGFAVYEHEWWHFDHADWRLYGVGNEPLR
jgi:D-alanyl-D-alanine dipeptidase/CubicO group peptidase (beta-lactamase class C family)